MYKKRIYCIKCGVEIFSRCKSLCCTCVRKKMELKKYIQDNDLSKKESYKLMIKGGFVE